MPVTYAPAGRIYPSGYRLPRKNVLLVSCMDLRLIDEIVEFMEHDNLTNRYDQFILAGSSLCTCFDHFETAFEPGVAVRFDRFESWSKSLFHHLELAIELHKIEDIYVLEHRQCGAYKEFLIEGFADDEDEKEGHKRFAAQLTSQIKKHTNQEIAKLHVHSFLMDLRGNMELLDSSARTPPMIGLNKTALS